MHITVSVRWKTLGALTCLSLPLHYHLFLGPLSQRQVAAHIRAQQEAIALTDDLELVGLPLVMLWAAETSGQR